MKESAKSVASSIVKNFKRKTSKVKKTKLSVEGKLRKLGMYGGPVLGYDKDEGMFVVFSWNDAPCEIVSCYYGETLTEAVTSWQEARDAVGI